MLRHIELKFCIWLCFNVLQIKFECHLFPSIFVGVLPLLELKILEIHSFLHFSLTCFDISSWNLAYDFVLLYYRSSSSVVNFYTPVFRRDVLWYGDVRPSVRLSVRPSDSPSGSPSARFPHFSHTCFDILSWTFAHDFVLIYSRSSLSVVTLRQFL